MPIREYQASDGERACDLCRQPFERLEPAAAVPLKECPQCGAALSRLLSAPAVGASRSSFDNRARQAGFHKLKRLGRGEYEKQY